MLKLGLKPTKLTQPLKLTSLDFGLGAKRKTGAPNEIDLVYLTGPQFIKQCSQSKCLS